jgi:trimeric autotransporter adhesin
MKKLYSVCAVLLLAIAPLLAQNIDGGRQREVFLKTDLSPSNALNDPWELTYGPDDSLWITESKGYAVYKLHPNGGTKRKVLDISLKSTWLGTTPASDSVFNLQFVFSPTNPQGGLAGMAIHPDFNTGKRYVYISYIRSYITTVTSPANGGVIYQNRIARFTYNTATGRLESPVSICDTLPGSSDHNSQRMIIAPVNGVNYLFYAAGDMGAGQFGNANRANNAQNSSIYEGKILRFNLEPDADLGAYDKWIPDDNPYNGAKESAIWSMGIRNNQGFAYDSVRGILYGASHGPFSDDEINIIQSGKNYGHPLVIGYSADGNYDGAKAGPASSSLPLITSEVANAASIGASYKDPIYSFHPAPKGNGSTLWSIQHIYINADMDPGPGTSFPQNLNGNWASEAVSGIGLYNYSIIPDWKNSLIGAGLKWGRLLRLKLNTAGTAVVPTNGADTVTYFESPNRYRDIAFGPGGKDIYVIMDKSAATSGPSANNPSLVACAGCLQKYTFLGYATSAGTSTIPSSVTIAAGKPNVCEDANTITINSNNASLWVPITDTSGNIVAEINANGNILGTVTTTLYTNNGPVREQSATRTLYLNRNITITPQTQPSTAVSVRLYLTTAEFNSLKTAFNSMSQSSGVNIPADLCIFKNGDACGSAIVAKPSRIVTTNQAAFGSSGYVIQASINSFSSFYVANVSSLLPVRLTAFNGSLVNTTGQLKWITEDEAGTKSFILERSTDGRAFGSIATVAAVNNSGTATYTYADSAITLQSSQVVFYRLKMTDADGKFSYSNVVKISLPKMGGVLNIRPNPVVGTAIVELTAAVAESSSWTVTDITGKTVLKKSIMLVKGNNTVSLGLTQLPAGTYYLKVAGNNISQSVKLQKL